jgi:hypothetical protein
MARRHRVGRTRADRRRDDSAAALRSRAAGAGVRSCRTSRSSRSACIRRGT